jgi:hypothetical protein
VHRHLFSATECIVTDLRFVPHRNYEQLGLKFKLYSPEVLFNKGLSLIYLGKYDAGMADLAEASAGKVTAEHGVIDEAIQDRGEGYTVFSIVRCFLSGYLFLRSGLTCSPMIVSPSACCIVRLRAN